MDTIKEVSPQALLVMLKDTESQVQILDVREHDEVADQPYQGLETLHVPMQTVPNKIKDFNKEATWVIACRSGGRSYKVAQFLQTQGFSDVYNLAGGVLAWQEIKNI